MKKIAIICCSFIVWSSLTMAQAGYIGKRSEISIDILHTLVLDQPDFTYKFSVSKHTSLFVNYGWTNATKDMDGVIYDNLTVNSPTIYYDFTQENVRSGSVHAELTNFGFGIMMNSSENNMQMPIGYYSGLGLFFNNGTITDEYIITDPLPDGLGNKVAYKASNTNLRFIFGKDNVLTNMVTLDLSLAIGFSWGSMKVDESSGYALRENEPYSEYPPALFFFGKKDFDSTSDGDFSYIRFYVTPNIRLGYIF